MTSGKIGDCFEYSTSVEISTKILSLWFSLKNSIFEVCWEIATFFNLVSMEMIQVIEVCFDIYFQQKQTLTVCRISHHKWWPYNFLWEKFGSLISGKTLCLLVKALCSKSFERCLRKWCSQRLNDRFSIKLKITSSLH